MSEARRRVKLSVRGRVQGVYFRESTRQQAERLGVAGYAMNLPDGTVEVVAEGPADAVEALVTFCGKGPPLARVDGLERTDEAPRGEHATFEIRRS